ncbi:MAG TPA: efflux RND transporter periplasmic adaptor subunit [Stellaceae bacterium]|nr:efflux RND transporter periplasmic adaptor subunit [Stellaceae bacterium]
MARRSAGATWVYSAGVVAVAAAAAGAAYFWRAGNIDLAAAREARANAVQLGPRVEVTTVSPGPAERTITLLADARPYATVTLYAKVSGYLKSIAVDRGDKVQTGQVLAEIESAETDSLYANATADADNKRKLAARNQELLTRGNVSLQAAEQSQTDLRVAEGNVRNLATMKSYEVLRAPFTGTVTARYADPGALVQNATTNQSSALPVLTITDSTKLRVGTYVEQRDVPFIRVGQAVDISDASNPDRVVHAVMSRSSGELDPRTRTLYVECDIDNAQAFLVPGSFVYLTLHVPIERLPRIPVNALIMRGDNAFVAEVSDSGDVHFRPVKVASTDGIMATLGLGIATGARVAMNLPGEVTDGSRIQPVAAAAGKQ